LENVSVHSRWRDETETGGEFTRQKTSNGCGVSELENAVAALGAVVSDPQAVSALSGEQARDVRARAWKFVFDTYAQKNPAADASERGEDGTKVQGDSANGILPH
jgi:hypothetical protein